MLSRLLKHFINWDTKSNFFLKINVYQYIILLFYIYEVYIFIRS